VPGWNFGWSSVLTDPISYDVLSWLGHYARQYVHRSNVAKVLMAAWERHNLVLHPFGSGLQIQRYSEASNPSTQQMLAIADRNMTEQWGRPLSKGTLYQSKWSTRNTLDPGIHQGIFHFLRGQSLAAAGFELEAVAAFDCVLHSLQYMDWSWAPGNPRRDRADLCRALGMGKASAELAEHV
jgi:hypothetical protein